MEGSQKSNSSFQASLHPSPTKPSDKVNTAPTQQNTTVLLKAMAEFGGLDIDHHTKYLMPTDYTLQPDIKAGWLPKLNAPGAPIPLRYDLNDDDYDENVNTKNVIYYGYRPINTFELHKAYSNKNTYPFNVSDRILSLINEISSYHKEDHKRACGMVQQDDLIFDSNFESGNLDLVVKLQENEYDLYMRTDSNTRGHNQWYNFTVRNKIRKSVKFNILNFTKKKSLYEIVFA
jgi:hypothetical protein